MLQKNIECIKVTKSNRSIDAILAHSEDTNNDCVMISAHSYFRENRNDLKHLVYSPGFGSGFDSCEQVPEIIKTLDQTDFDTAFLMFLNAKVASEFETLYYSNNKLTLTDLSSRQLISLNIEHKSEEEILAKIARGNRQKIKSTGIPFKIITGYDKKFFPLYQSLADTKQFSKTYQFRENDLESLSKQDNIFFIGIEVEDKFLAASFFRLVETSKEKRMDYLLSASLPISSSKWTAKVLWQGIKLAFENNCKSFNFGGGVVDGDNLHNYKLGFGGQVLPFYRCRIINRLGEKKERLVAQNILRNKYFP